MAFTPPSHYYNRFDPTKQYEQHLFRAGYVIQSAEFNEVQSASQHRLKQIADALFDDGAIISGAECIVNADTGACQCQGGAVYLRGAVRGVIPATFTVATSGIVAVGLYLIERVVTELEDPGLRDPATGMRNYQEPGASRLQVTALWGFSGDGQAGEFYPVYTIENGVLQPKVPPPAVDAIAVALARYDRQSAGGYYVVSGLNVIRLQDVGGKQLYSLGEGVARVNGEEIILQHAQRIEYAAVPDTKLVSLEPHMAAGGTERVTLNHSPIFEVQQVSITKEETITLTHGAYSGAVDLLPKTPVVQITLVKQGATTYTQGTDFKLTADTVDWSLMGAEPAPGSTYSVTYRYIATATPTALDGTGFTVTGAVAGTLIQTSYRWAMPRIDRLCINSEGRPVWVKGVSAPVYPIAPGVPVGLLALASVYQLWTADTQVRMDGIRVVPMSELNTINTQIERLYALVAEERLALNLTMRDPTAKKGVFADAFHDDDLRDQGLAQTGAVFNQELTLGAEATVFSQSLGSVQTLDARVITETVAIVGQDEVVIAQLLRTGAMQINPYMAFSPLPGVALLTPAVDYWTDTQTQFLSPETRQVNEDVWTNFAMAAAMTQQFGGGLTMAQFDLNIGFFSGHTAVTTVESVTRVLSEKVGTKYVDLQYLRQIPVRFNLSGFGGGEVLRRVIFDGRDVTFSGV